MNSTACLIFISLLCAADLTQSKTTNHGQKDGKGIYSTSTNHIENHWNITSDLAERRSLKKVLHKTVVGEMLHLTHSDELIKVVNLPGSKKLAKLIPEENDKKKYLVKEMGIAPSIAKILSDKDLIVSPKLRMALLYHPVYGPWKALKFYDKQSISKIMQNKVTDFKKQSFKAFGVLPLNSVYRNNQLTLERGHMIGGKLLAEDDEAYWFSYNFLNVVPMYPAFNGPIYFQMMERQFLKFAEEATSSEDEVVLTVNISPDTRFDKQTGLGVPVEERWFGQSDGRQINIVQSVNVMAFSLPKTGRGGRVFAFVGNNDKSFPEGYFPREFTDFQNYYNSDGDLALSQFTKHLKELGYTTWHPELDFKGRLLD